MKTKTVSITPSSGSGRSRLISQLYRRKLLESVHHVGNKPAAVTDVGAVSLIDIQSLNLAWPYPTPATQRHKAERHASSGVTGTHLMYVLIRMARPTVWSRRDDRPTPGGGPGKHDERCRASVALNTWRSRRGQRVTWSTRNRLF